MDCQWHDSSGHDGKTGKSRIGADVPYSLNDPCAINRANRIAREVAAEHQRGHRRGKVFKRDPQGHERAKEANCKLNAARCED